MSEEIVPYLIDVDASEIEDLRMRLARTRWPEPSTVSDWSQGVPRGYLQTLCRYWAEDYDWDHRQARLNSLPQFKTTIEGLGIHFVHLRSRHQDALPLLITHGWPGSFAEFFDVAGPLTNPEQYGGQASDAFHLVVPSLPGYGFSDKPTAPGWGVEKTAAAWALLMSRLGYRRYGAQGGDWGSLVTTSLAHQDAEHLAGIHLNMVLGFPGPDDGQLTEFETSALAALDHYQKRDSGYSKQQSTRPQTLGYALIDSPAGQCAWILEKFWSWSDTGGDPVGVLGADRILDDVMLYWLPGTASSSARMYWESFNNPPLGLVSVPMGASMFPREIFRASQRWASRQYSDIRYWGEPAVGGHFAAFEQPGLFVEEVRRFFRMVR